MKRDHTPAGLNIERYPPTQNRSLRAWSAADELMLRYTEKIVPAGDILLINDRFGFQAIHLAERNPVVIIDRKSQERALRLNLELNGIDSESVRFFSPIGTESLTYADTILLLVPKSMELFRFWLALAASRIKAGGTVVCGFMTRHFTPQMLETADHYFESAEQSRAEKKARLLILKDPKPDAGMPGLIRIDELPSGIGTNELVHYPGVFSSGRIDPATLFLLEKMQLRPDEKLILDLASGNGIIAVALSDMNPGAEIHCMDDSLLAIESSRINLKNRNACFHWNDRLSDTATPNFDLIVTNPPFHFGHENNIEVTLRLFREASGKLRSGGRLVTVENKHLNYQTHLSKIFREVRTFDENERFRITESI